MIEGRSSGKQTSFIIIIINNTWMNNRYFNFWQDVEDDKQWKPWKKSIMYGLFVCLLFVPLDNFSFIWRRHHWWLRAANFDLCSAPMAIEQWEFLKVPYLLWHEASINNGHLWAPVRLSLIAERLAVELSLSDIYNFGRPMLDYHYYMLSLFDPCPRVDKKWCR